jgi:O-antigen ligase
VIAGLIVSISYQLIPDYFQYYVQRLFKISITPLREYIFFSDAYLAAYDTNEYFYKDTSEGYRIFLIGEMFKYLSNSPFFGSGFLGVWIMFDNLAGAAHNQLLDVMFRTGVLGFLGFIYLLYRIVKYNFRLQNWAVLVSLAGILVIGFFHETFKLSQGAFVFAFLAAQSFNER